MDNWQKLVTNGFMIYPVGNKFRVKKNAVPINSLVIDEQEYESYDLAVEAATDMLSPSKIEWTAIIRYNRGLGIEYKNLQPVEAKTKEEAESIFISSIKLVFLGEDIDLQEIRVRPKN